MDDWKVGTFDDDGDGWEDVAAVPVVSAPTAPRSAKAKDGVAGAGAREPPRARPRPARKAAEGGGKALVGTPSGNETAAEPAGTAGIVASDPMDPAETIAAMSKERPTAAASAAAATAAASAESRGGAAEDQESNGHVAGDVTQNAVVVAGQGPALAWQASNGEHNENDQAVAKLTAALAASEKKVAVLTRERDGLRKARGIRANNSELAKEKDKQILAILAEGEKLSVKIAEKETSLRTLRSSVKDQAAEIEQLKIAISATEAKLQGSAAKQRALETSEKAAVEGKEAAERRLRQMESDMRTKSSSSAALEAARSQLESLRKTHAAALENQSMELRAEAEMELEKMRASAKEEQDALNKAISELRSHLTQVTENAGWKEDQLRKEMKEMRTRAESLEARNEELAEAVPGATAPLLRQVEALQAAAHERTRAISAVERAQVDRLHHAEAAIAAGAERERAAEERIGALLSRIAALEEQVKLVQTESGRLSSELRDSRGAAAQADLDHQRALDSAQVVGMKMLREKESAIDELSKARAAHLDDMEAAEDRERKLSEKVSLLEAKIESLQARLATSQARVSSPGYGTPHGFDFDTFARSESNSSSLHPLHHRLASGEDLLSPRRAEDASGSGKWTARSATIFDNEIGSGDFLAESVSAPGGVYDTERLNASLRQRCGEIASLQAQLASKDAASQALAEEVVSLAARADELTKELSDAPALRKEFEEFKVRHLALLELHGEREERVLELEADLADINQMYKEQITELLLKLEQQT